MRSLWKLTQKVSASLHYIHNLSWYNEYSTLFQGAKVSSIRHWKDLYVIVVHSRISERCCFAYIMWPFIIRSLILPQCYTVPFDYMRALHIGPRKHSLQMKSSWRLYRLFRLPCQQCARTKMSPTFSFLRTVGMSTAAVLGLEGPTGFI